MSGDDHASHKPMTAAYLPIYTIISFYLRILLFISGIIVLATAAATLNVQYSGYCVGYYCTDSFTVQFHESRFAIFAGVFTFVFAGILNIALSFFSKGLVVAIMTVIDFLTAWFSLGSGIAAARLIEYYAFKGTISACCAFGFVAMAVAATLFAFDLIELLSLRSLGPGFTGSIRDFPLTVAALTSSPFISHSYSKDQPANPNSTILEHTEPAVEPLEAEQYGGALKDAPFGFPDGAQYEPKPIV